MASKSKSKGSRFEYTVRDLLNKLYDCKEFARTPGSGAIMGRSNFNKRAGMSDAAKETLSADIICPPWFPYSIEAKNYADKPVYHTMIQSYDITLDSWLGEAIYDAKNSNRVPLLFFNTTRKGSYVAVPSIIADHMVLKNHLIYRDFKIMAMSMFAENANVIKDKGPELLDKVQHWINTSECAAVLLDVIAKKSSAAKNKKKKTTVEEPE